MNLPRFVDIISKSAESKYDGLDVYINIALKLQSVQLDAYTVGRARWIGSIDFINKPFREGNSIDEPYPWEGTTDGFVNWSIWKVIWQQLTEPSELKGVVRILQVKLPKSKNQIWQKSYSDTKNVMPYDIKFTRNISRLTKSIWQKFDLTEIQSCWQKFSEQPEPIGANLSCSIITGIHTFVKE